MRLIYTTVIRQAPVKYGGWVTALDYPSMLNKVSRRIVPSNPSVVDPNPRGNSRGGRGIGLWKSFILLAGYHSIEICDAELNCLGRITDKNFAGIHEIYVEGDVLYVTSTANNVVGVVQLATCDLNDHQISITMPHFHVRLYWPSENARVMKRLGLKPAICYQKDLDNRLNHLDLHNRGNTGHLHLNAVGSNGIVHYALLSKPGAILNLDDMEIVLISPMLQGAHNLTFVSESTAFIVSTRSGLLLEFDSNRKTLTEKIDLNATGYARKTGRLKMFRTLFRRRRKEGASYLFWRGLAVSDQYVFVGTSPAAILVFERSSLRHVDTIVHSRSVHEVIHGIEVV